MSKDIAVERLERAFSEFSILGKIVNISEEMLPYYGEVFDDYLKKQKPDSPENAAYKEARGLIDNFVKNHKESINAICKMVEGDDPIENKINMMGNFFPKHQKMWDDFKELSVKITRIQPTLDSVVKGTTERGTSEKAATLKHAGVFGVFQAFQRTCMAASILPGHLDKVATFSDQEAKEKLRKTCEKLNNGTGEVNDMLHKIDDFVVQVKGLLQNGVDKKIWEGNVKGKNEKLLESMQKEMKSVFKIKEGGAEVTALNIDKVCAKMQDLSKKYISIIDRAADNLHKKYQKMNSEGKYFEKEYHQYQAERNQLDTMKAYASLLGDVGGLSFYRGSEHIETVKAEVSNFARDAKRGLLGLEVQRDSRVGNAQDPARMNEKANETQEVEFKTNFRGGHTKTEEVSLKTTFKSSDRSPPSNKMAEGAKRIIGGQQGSKGTSLDTTPTIKRSH